MCGPDPNTHSLTHTHTLRPRLFTPPRFGTHPSTSPSCEGLECIKAVVEESKKYGVTVHRVSQGSGINMMPRAETIDMLRVGRDNQLEVKCVCVCVCVCECVCVWEDALYPEGVRSHWYSRPPVLLYRHAPPHPISALLPRATKVCLFVGPRNAWDISAVARTDAGRNR